MNTLKKFLKKIWDLMLLGYQREYYINLFSKGLISREEMLEKTA